MRRPVRPNRPLAAARALLAVLACGLWLAATTESLVHSVATAHALCEEHGQVEDTAVAGGEARPVGADALYAGDDGAHAPCSHAPALRDGGAGLPPPTALALLAPAWVVVPRLSPTTADDASPRGPPTWRLAPKTSPPPSA